MGEKGEGGRGIKILPDVLLTDPTPLLLLLLPVLLLFVVFP